MITLIMGNKTYLLRKKVFIIRFKIRLQTRHRSEDFIDKHTSEFSVTSIYILFCGKYLYEIIIKYFVGFHMKFQKYLNYLSITHISFTYFL